MSSNTTNKILIYYLIKAPGEDFCHIYNYDQKVENSIQSHRKCETLILLRFIGEQL